MWSCFRRRQRKFIACIRTRRSLLTLSLPSPSCVPSVPTFVQMKGPSTCCFSSCRRKRGSPSWNRTERRYRVKIVKFARGLHAKVSPMNDVDIGVYQLMQSEQLLSQKVESLSQEAEKCKEDARSACRAGKKQLALRCLKSKRRTERRIEELHSKLDAVQGILDRIYASQTDQMVFNAYQAGVGALKLSMKDVTVEKAENLVDQIQELCDTQDEVAQTLAGVGINGLAEMDTEELEKELDSLLQDSTKEPVDLPPVPQKVLNPPISDAELEAELEKLSLADGDLAQKTPSASSEPKTALGLNL
ncbi:PREDICTED: charged multivesicular body protein 7 isoform X3 [Calidris pugnax]|uniref:charged multivesicular body protein 7 isoform X3 n=1 Tax=Calidris pugnax TaxID=198806 RepID=UPI00071CE103|nr:PREDICTED: charged multivesicular body protein 7 isoform X3 [Calidris pugnax]